MAIPFENLVAEFCDYLEHGEVERSRLRDLLSALDIAATQIPHVEPSTAEYPDPVGLDDACRQVAALISRTFGERTFYEAVRGDEVTVGLLSDDFFDIYRDLRRGAEISTRSATDALWEWRFSHEVHWGFHARDALAAIEAIEGGEA